MKWSQFSYKTINTYAEKHMTKIHQIDVQKNNQDLVKFIYSEKATKFCEISTSHLTAVHTFKSKVEISQNFVAFSEYMNFTKS